MLNPEGDLVAPNEDREQEANHERSRDVHDEGAPRHMSRPRDELLDGVSAEDAEHSGTGDSERRAHNGTLRRGLCRCQRARAARGGPNPERKGGRCAVGRVVAYRPRPAVPPATLWSQERPPPLRRIEELR